VIEALDADQAQPNVTLKTPQFARSRNAESNTMEWVDPPDETYPIP